MANIPPQENVCLYEEVTPTRIDKLGFDRSLRRAGLQHGDVVVVERDYSERERLEFLTPDFGAFVEDRNQLLKDVERLMQEEEIRKEEERNREKRQQQQEERRKEEDLVRYIKCRYGDDIVKIPCKKTTTFEMFLMLVEEEWGEEGLGIKYEDEEGDMVKMRRTEELEWVWMKRKTHAVKVEVFSNQVCFYFCFFFLFFFFIFYFFSCFRIIWFQFSNFFLFVLFILIFFLCRVLPGI